MHTQAALDAMWSAVYWKLAIICCIGGLVTWYLGNRWFPSLKHNPHTCRCHKK